MQFKRTLLFIGKQQIVLLLFMICFTMTIGEWREDGYLDILIFITLFQIPVFLCGIASLFSKKHALEGALERSIGITSIPMQVLGWGVVAAITLPGLYMFPFPATIAFYIAIFNFFYSIGVTVTQRLGLGVIGGIALAEESSVFGFIIRYATAIYFFPVYLTLSRISSLPLYVRKPLGLLTVMCWCGLLFMTAALFDK